MRTVFFSFWLLEVSVTNKSRLAFNCILFHHQHYFKLQFELIIVVKEFTECRSNPFYTVLITENCFKTVTISDVHMVKVIVIGPQFLFTFVFRNYILVFDIIGFVKLTVH